MASVSIAEKLFFSFSVFLQSAHDRAAGPQRQPETADT